MKKIKVLILTILLATVFNFTKAGDISLTLSTVSGSVGNAVIVPVNATGIANMEAFQFTIEYDVAKLSFNNCSDWGGGTLANIIEISPDNVTGNITFYYQNFGTPINLLSNVFFNLNFTVKADANSFAYIRWSDNPITRELTNNIADPIICTWNDGGVNIQGLPVVAVTSIAVTPKTLEMTLTINTDSTLTADILPNNATNKTVTWTSDNDLVAVVSTEGIVKPLAAGVAKITATTIDGGFTDYCTVTVKDPVFIKADFSSDNISGIVPLTVKFTDNSTGAPTKWLWSFGDDATSTEQNPSHTYTSIGVFTVKLIINLDKQTDSIIKTDLITVDNIVKTIKADFITDITSGGFPLTVNFTDKSTGSPTKWEWLFGDGEISTEQNPTHTFANHGTYTVQLTVSNETESDYIIIGDLINVTGGTSFVVQGKALYDNASFTPLSNIMVFLTSLDNSFKDTATTDVDGNYYFIDIPKGFYNLTATKTNGWGSVDPGDALTINRTYIGLITLTSKLTELAADVTADGSIDPGDALMVNRRYIEAISKFIIGDWLFENISITVAETDVVQDIKGICAGDANNTFSK